MAKPRKERAYEVEFKSTTYRSYSVLAPNIGAAEISAWDSLADDEGSSQYVSDAWIENAKVTNVVRLADDKIDDLHDVSTCKEGE